MFVKKGDKVRVIAGKDKGTDSPFRFLISISILSSSPVTSHVLLGKERDRKSVV